MLWVEKNKGRETEKDTKFLIFQQVDNKSNLKVIFNMNHN